MEQFTSFIDLINHFADKLNYEQSSWYKGYKNTHQQVMANPTSDASLELLWYTRDNSVSSLKQGAPSSKEFQEAKEVFSEISKLITQSPNEETYKLVQNKLKQAKQNGVVSKMYWALLNRAFAAVAPERVTSTVDADSFKMVVNYINKQFGFDVNLDGNWFENNIRFKEAIAKQLPEGTNPYYVNMAVWHTCDQLAKDAQEAKEKKQNNKTNKISEPSSKRYQMDNFTPLNQILYGPPGTGKTYHTIEAAVKAAEPVQYAALDINDVVGANKEQREQLTQLYKRLTGEKRIRFVTFHQSYGYEEFVEGLRANSDEGVISYDVEPGIFRQICTDASKNIAKSMQLNSKTDFSVCWDEFLNAFDEEGVKIQTKKSSFMVTEITDKTIHFEKAQGTSHHSLAIKTLRGVFDGSKVIKGGLNVYYQPLVEHLKQFSKKDTLVSEPLKNFVLIIDEINRGNISKIFGELITLIEDSKRAHPSNTEALEVVLPNSGDSFSVPSNLYLIGTMNTADRSLAMMDTALRRRFDFVEMMPKPHLFDGILVEGISLTKLLFTMNRRIEALYDREHTLGHAFFVPVMLAFESGDEQRAFEELKSVFTNKVIPLLEEYFFDDWNKIRLVLGDNQKPEYLQFVTQDEVPYQELFGDNHGLDTYEQAQSTYSLVSYLEQDTVWDNAAAYQAIYTSDNV